MNGQPKLDLWLTAWLHAAAPDGAPTSVVDGTVQATIRIRPLPAWRAMLSVQPMRSHPRVLVGSPVVRTARIVAILVALTMLLVMGGLIGAGISQRPPADPRPLDAVPFEMTFRLHPEAIEGVTWTLVESGSRGRRFQAREDRADRVLGNLTVEQPATLREDWGRRKVPVPTDLVGWLQAHSSLDVASVSDVTIAGRLATAVDVEPVYPVPSPMTPRHARYWYLTPYLWFDGSWRYRMVLVNAGITGWAIATCEARRDRWEEAADACDDLLATWEWLEP